VNNEVPQNALISLLADDVVASQDMFGCMEIVYLTTRSLLRCYTYVNPSCLLCWIFERECRSQWTRGL